LADAVWERPILALRDPEAVPVLVALLDDSEPLTRSFAADVLGTLGHDARPAIPRLRQIAQDRSRYSLAGGFIVPGLSAADALVKIDPGTLREDTDRP
jgi:hypothetical protein